MPEPINFLVDRCFLRNVCVGRRYVCLWLVVVIVGNKVLHGIIREEPFEFLVELGRKRLVMGDYQRRPLHFLDHLSDRESFP